MAKGLSPRRNKFTTKYPIFLYEAQRTFTERFESATLFNIQLQTAPTKHTLTAKLTAYDEMEQQTTDHFIERNIETRMKDKINSYFVRPLLEFVL